MDKRAVKLLRLLKRQTPMPQQTPQQVRDAMLKNGNPFAPPQANVHYSRDHYVEHDGERLLLREYSAVPQDAASPCLLFFHGGGFVIGSVAEYDTVCGQLAEKSAARVFSFEYRRAPEVKYPVPHRDAYAAYQWLLERRFSLKLSHIGVCGDSAGGNLAASLCLWARDHGLELPALQILWYPMTHGDKEFPSRKEFGSDYFITRDDMLWFSEQLFKGAQQASDVYFAPGLAKDLSGLPPALVLTAGYDVLRDEGREYARQLAQAGNQVEHRCYDDVFHGFISFGGGLPQGMQAIAESAAFFREHIGK